MVQHADGIHKVEALRLERQVMDVGLRDAHVVEALVVSFRDIDRRADVDGPDLGAVLRGVIGVTSAAASRVQDAFATERFRRVWQHVIPEVVLPLGAHFRETAPLEPEAPGRLYAQPVKTREIGSRVPAAYRPPHRGGDHPWNPVHHRKVLVAARTAQRDLRRSRRGQNSLASRTPQKLKIGDRGSRVGDRLTRYDAIFTPPFSILDPQSSYGRVRSKRRPLPPLYEFSIRREQQYRRVEQ